MLTTCDSCGEDIESMGTQDGEDYVCADCFERRRQRWEPIRPRIIKGGNDVDHHT